MECPWQNIHMAVLGCGFMGTAILKGLLNKTRQNGTPSVKYTAWVRSRTSLERLHHALGDDSKQINCVGGGDLVGTLRPADVVILGFPPNELNTVFATPGLADALRGKLVVSLLAGVSSAQLTSALQPGTKPGPDHHVLRVIPTVGATINDSVTLIAEPTSAGPQQQQVTAWLFEQLGQTQWLPESLMNEATGAGAACNALVMVAVDAIVDAGVAEGMPRATAMRLAAASLSSAAGLLVEGGMSPESLKEAMSVPKGITVNAVLELERGSVRAAVSEAVRGAVRYTRGMAG
ncbi:pyrroline-5-carboxylate reductase [Usnea florida]